jgi:hypothetical protein
VEYLRSALGDEAWEQGTNPEVPETSVLDNPYTYTDCSDESTHGQGRPSTPVLGNPVPQRVRSPPRFGNGALLPHARRPSFV